MQLLMRHGQYSYLAVAVVVGLSDGCLVLRMTKLKRSRTTVPHSTRSTFTEVLAMS